MCARADLPEVLHRCGVPWARRERPPEQVLVERQRAGVRVAVVQIHVGGLQVGGRERDPLANRRLQVRHMVRDPSLDPVGVALAELLRPAAVAGIELAGAVALHDPGQLLQLDPKQPGSFGRAAGIHRQRLADHDGRLRREQAALGLVDGARDSVETGCEVDDCGPAESLVPLPLRRLGQGVVDLHLRPAVAEAPAQIPVAVEQPSVELSRRHVGDHRATGVELLPACEAHA